MCAHGGSGNIPMSKTSWFPSSCYKMQFNIFPCSHYASQSNSHELGCSSRSERKKELRTCNTDKRNLFSEPKMENYTPFNPNQLGMYVIRRYTYTHAMVFPQCFHSEVCRTFFFFIFFSFSFLIASETRDP